MAVTDPMFELLASQLRAYGLGALFTRGPSGEPGGWLWDQLRQGIDSSDELMIALEATDVFRARFGVIAEQQRRAAAGQPVYVMSPAEVIEYETRARQMMAAANLPEWFYDQPEDFQTLILNDMSLAEVQERIQQTYEYVNNAPPEVRDFFSATYGVAQSDAALAAYVLDPNKTIGQLERARRTAYTGGMAARFDLQLSAQMAERIAQLPQTEAGIVSGLEQIARQSSLFEEGLFERGDLSATNEGVASVFEGDAAATRALERRRVTRGAPARAQTGGAVTTARGVTGAGYADSG